MQPSARNSCDKWKIERTDTQPILNNRKTQRPHSERLLARAGKSGHRNEGHLRPRTRARNAYAARGRLVFKANGWAADYIKTWRLPHGHFNASIGSKQQSDGEWLTSMLYLMVGSAESLCRCSCRDSCSSHAAGLARPDIIS